LVQVEDGRSEEGGVGGRDVLIWAFGSVADYLWGSGLIDRGGISLLLGSSVSRTQPKAEDRHFNLCLLHTGVLCPCLAPDTVVSSHLTGMRKARPICT
jgi:hypothetical protein